MRLKNEPSIGMNTIEGIVYPDGAEVNIKVKRNGKVDFDATRTAIRLSFVQGLEHQLKDDDMVIISVTAPDFAPLTSSYIVY